jgi:hypothetical protein
MSNYKHPLSCLLVLLLGSIFPASNSHAAEFDPNATSLIEESSPDPLLRFKYRLVPSTNVVTTEVKVDDKPIESRATPYADNPLNISVLMILVDNSTGSTSHPRTLTLEANKQVISEILTRARPNMQLGLSTFANDLVTVAPMGSPIADIQKALPQIKADGLGTRLYLRGMDAIAQLEKVKADRKALLIFSDGKDEDTGYTLENLINAAKKSKIILLAVGCPERQQDIPALGNLQKAANETLGFYDQMQLVQNGQRIAPKNPPTITDDLLKAVAGGGEVVASLKNVAPSAKVSVNLTTKDGQKLEQMLQRSVSTVSPSPSPVASPTPSSSPDPKPTPTPKQGLEFATDWASRNTAWVIVCGVAVVGIFSIALIGIRAGRKKKPVPSPQIPMPIERQKPAATLAYLVLQDANSTRLSVNKTATRIGRRADNDIVFSNDSVSGHHAELHMSRDGDFSITDLGSGNGVFLNGSRIQQGKLKDGDAVELGEVRFRFTVA